eukprot:GILK01002275.1.p1 GENE.GILK01002275.1~~GILK01002275.1.p1  ORF type:complete len:310 (+),score=27.99 GILK01002275.1:53-931(+)
MDIALELLDPILLDPVYASFFPAPFTVREWWVRQSLSLFFIFTLGGILMYLSSAIFSYYTMFDHNIKKHPKYLKDQIFLEIQVAVSSIPLMAILTTPCILGEVRGYSRLHNEWRGVWDTLSSVVFFLVFTDALIYWIHRGLHHPSIYALFHKPHHRWVVTTPFASHAFHPIDGFLQSSPYHIFVYLFPMNKVLYLFMFFIVNIWTVSIHDGNYKLPGSIINSAAHHTDHHLFFNYNYGQYFTFWDRLCGSYRYPSSYEHDKILKPSSVSSPKKNSPEVSCTSTSHHNKPKAA